MKIPEKIDTAKQALKLSQGIKSIWSHEALILNQRTLIYIAELLERSAKKSKADKDKRWHKFLKKCLKLKLSVQQAQDLWRST